MIGVPDADVFANKRIVANRDAAPRGDDASRIDADTITKRDFSRLDSIEMNTPSEAAFFADTQVSGATGRHRTIELCAEWYMPAALGA